MNPTDLLKTLETEGVNVSLNLKLEADTKPSDETRALIRDNRDGLLEYLIAQANGTRVSHLGNVSNVRGATHLEQPSNFQHVGTLQLYGDLLYNLMIWVSQYQELRIEHQNGVVLDAKPEHVRDALGLHAWGLVYDIEGRVLVSWGDVPTSALLDKRDLVTDELLVRETRAA